MIELKQKIKELGILRLFAFTALAAILVALFLFIVQNAGTVVATLFRFLRGAFTALAPLFIGLILAYLFSPLSDFLETRLFQRHSGKRPSKDGDAGVRQRKRRRIISVLTSLLLIFAASTALLGCFAFFLTGHPIFGEPAETVSRILSCFNRLEQEILSLSELIPLGGIKDNLKQWIDAVPAKLTDSLDFSSLTELLSRWGGRLLDLLLGIILSAYLMIDKDFYLRLFRKALHVFLPMGPAARLRYALRDADSVLSLFLRGQLLDALIVSVLASAAFSLIRLDAAVLLGCFAGLANVIPYFGVVLGMAAAFLTALLTAGVSRGLLAAFILLIIQQLDANLIYPRIVGRSIGLHPAAVLTSVAFGGFFWGVPGMILAVPATALLKLFLLRTARDREP